MRIKVRAVPGRIARTAPRGEFIPDDRFVRVERTPYIDRLLNVHGDIITEPKKVPVKKGAAPAPKAPPKEG